MSGQTWQITMEQNFTHYYNHFYPNFLKFTDHVEHYYFQICSIALPILVYTTSGSAASFTNIFLWFLFLLTTIVKVWKYWERVEQKAHQRPVPIRASITTSGNVNEPVSPYFQSRRGYYVSPGEKRRGINERSDESVSSYKQLEDFDDTSTIGASNDGSNFKNREPLNSREWSEVTSPGFATRICNVVRKAGIHEINANVKTWNRSPFQYSPDKDLQLGQVAFGSKWTGNMTNPLPLQTLIHKEPTSWTGGNKSITGLSRGLNNTGYVPIKRIDPNKSISDYVSSISTRRNTNEILVNKQTGLGGTPTQAIMSKNPNQLVASANNILENSRVYLQSPIPYNSILSSSSTPSTILEALSSRKRNRGSDICYDYDSPQSPGKRTSPSISGIGGIPNDDSPKNTKRVKFITHDDPNTVLPYSMVPLPDLNVNEDETMMPTESILEKMNQTEKRYLPDDDTPPSIRPLPKKARSGNIVNVDRTLGIPGPSPVRKRKLPISSFGILDDEIQEKTPRFCTCTECYEEAAGVHHEYRKVESCGVTSDETAKTTFRKVVDQSTETEAAPTIPKFLGSEKPQLPHQGSQTKRQFKNDTSLRSKRLQAMLEVPTRTRTNSEMKMVPPTSILSKEESIVLESPMSTSSPQTPSPSSPDASSSQISQNVDFQSSNSTDTTGAPPPYTTPTDGDTSGSGLQANLQKPQAGNEPTSTSIFDFSSSQNKSNDTITKFGQDTSDLSRGTNTLTSNGSNVTRSFGMFGTPTPVSTVNSDTAESTPVSSSASYNQNVSSTTNFQFGQASSTFGKSAAVDSSGFGLQTSPQTPQTTLGMPSSTTSIFDSPSSQHRLSEATPKFGQDTPEGNRGTISTLPSVSSSMTGSSFGLFATPKSGTAQSTSLSSMGSSNQNVASPTANQFQFGQASSSTLVKSALEDSSGFGLKTPQQNNLSVPRTASIFDFSSNQTRPSETTTKFGQDTLEGNRGTSMLPSNSSSTTGSFGLFGHPMSSNTGQSAPVTSMGSSNQNVASPTTTTNQFQFGQASSASGKSATADSFGFGSRTSSLTPQQSIFSEPRTTSTFDFSSNQNRPSEVISFGQNTRDGNHGISTLPSISSNTTSEFGLFGGTNGSTAQSGALSSFGNSISNQNVTNPATNQFQFGQASSSTPVKSATTVFGVQTTSQTPQQNTLSEPRTTSMFDFSSSQNRQTGAIPKFGQDVPEGNRGTGISTLPSVSSSTTGSFGIFGAPMSGSTAQSASVSSMGNSSSNQNVASPTNQFQFGQASASPTPGGFNFVVPNTFSPGTPAPGIPAGNTMFSFGNSSSPVSNNAAPRRRPATRGRKFR